MIKVAKIVSRATMCSDDGRALALEWQLFLNDHARSEASKLGYDVCDVQWG